MLYVSTTSHTRLWPIKKHLVPIVILQPSSLKANRSRMVYPATSLDLSTGNMIHNAQRHWVPEVINVCGPLSRGGMSPLVEIFQVSGERKLARTV